MMKLFSKKLGWAATSRHDFDLEIYTLFWPPFYSTNFFLPKLSISIKNNGSRLNKASIEVEVRKYEGDISSVTTVNDAWGDVGGEGRMNIKNWEPGTKKPFVAKIPSRRLPSSGTYIVRVKVVEWIPLGTPYEELVKELKKVNLDENARKKVLEMSITQMEEQGIDPHRLQIGGFKGKEVFDGRVVEYFRVEQFSNVINFWLVSATMFSVFTTLAPNLSSWVSSLYNFLLSLWK